MKSNYKKIIIPIVMGLAIAALTACSGSELAELATGNSYSCSVSQEKANAVKTGMNLTQVRNIIGCDGRLYNSQGASTSYFFEESISKNILVVFYNGAVAGSPSYHQ